MPKIPALPFVRSGITSGLSANQALRDYQAAARQATAETGERWTATDRTVFLQLYSQTRAIREQTAEAMAAPKNIPAGGLTIPERASVRATGYGQWARIYSRPVGGTEVEPLYYFVRSDVPLTPQEVEDRARADFEANAIDEHGSMFNNVISGVAFTGIERLVPTEGL